MSDKTRIRRLPERAVDDYVAAARVVAPVADYLVVNVSSPNTPGLRDLQRPDALRELVAAVDGMAGHAGRKPPLLVKLSPDLGTDEMDALVPPLLEAGAAGLVIANTTTRRPALRSPSAEEEGGLSGAPILAMSTGVLDQFRGRLAGKVALIGAGGILSAADARRKVAAGAALVQLYTALVFGGPVLLGGIKTGLAELLQRDGFASVAGAVGADHRHETEISIGTGPAS